MQWAEGDAGAYTEARSLVERAIHAQQKLAPRILAHVETRDPSD